MKRRGHSKGWNALDKLWKAIDRVPYQKTTLKFAHRKYSIRNQAIKRYLATGEPEAIDDI